MGSGPIPSDDNKMPIGKEYWNQAKKEKEQADTRWKSPTGEDYVPVGKSPKEVNRINIHNAAEKNNKNLLELAKNIGKIASLPITLFASCATKGKPPQEQVPKSNLLVFQENNKTILIIENHRFELTEKETTALNNLFRNVIMEYKAASLDREFKVKSSNNEEERKMLNETNEKKDLLKKVESWFYGDTSNIPSIDDIRFAVKLLGNYIEYNKKFEKIDSHELENFENIVNKLYENI